MYEKINYVVKSLAIIALFNQEIASAMEKKLYIADPQQYAHIEPQYPSYVGQNHYGLCLRAANDLPKGTVVATADLEKTDLAYIAGNPDQIHIALMDVALDGTPTWGKVRGKWAFCNHSCDPNCDLSDAGEIITNRDVKKGQELTTAYDAYIANFPWPETWNFICLCEQPNCKKVIREYRMDIIDPITRKRSQSGDSF